jgi:ribosome biogenesis SPOUT family RNA methylase Rps3
MAPVHSVLRLQKFGSQAVLQPFEGDEVAGPALLVDLDTGTAQLSPRERVEGSYTLVYGVVGVVQLRGGYALLVITAGEKVARLRGGAVWKVTKTALVISDNVKRSKYPFEDKKYVDGTRVWLPSWDPMSYCACRLGPRASYWFQ